ncbi:MAG: 5'-methylthioadenosine/S-adenosylhomocysteine nucleosidase, partial [Okeania sp. SIO2D1]|nr:5'-methylthioadenosine/S-adenosylhomocysteine nucleosidase [Okeania sp. SIO2D1]
MPNSRIFSDLPQDDLIQLDTLLQNILINIDGIAGRKAILKNAGIDNYFIVSLDFNLSMSELSLNLVSKFKDYPVSSRNSYYHPLIALLEYVLKKPERYSLEDGDIEFYEKIISIGKSKIEELKTGSSVLPSPPNNQSPIPPIPNTKPPSSTIDILIITALKDELDALKNCDNQSGNTWQEFKDNSGYPYYKTTLPNKNGKKLNILAARPVEMGENYANNLATRLVAELKPDCLAMTGVCAGNKEEVFLGDV